MTERWEERDKVQSIEVAAMVEALQVVHGRLYVLTAESVTALPAWLLDEVGEET